MITQNIFRRFSWFLSFSLFLVLLSSCGSQKTIVNGLDEKEANEIIVFLNSRNIEANKMMSPVAAGGGQHATLWDITVSSDRSNEAMALLNDAGLPRRRGQNLLNIFSGQGLVPSDVEQKIRYQQGLAEQIASVIRKIDGVLEADVQLSFPEEDVLNPNAVKGKVTASVYVKHNGVLDDPNAHLVTKIKRLVASSVPGLNYDDVTVIGDKARGMDLTTPEGGPVTEDTVDYVSIWSIVLAKTSVTRFRAIFFSFSIIILGLVLLQIWIAWKLYPLLHAKGGFKQLFSMHPLVLEEAVEKPTDAQEKTDAAKKAEEKVVQGEVSDTDERT